MLLLSGRADAQSAAPAPAAPAVNAATAGASPADIQALIATLQNDADRAKLVKQLQALVAVQKEQHPPPTPATLLNQAGEKLQQLGVDVAAAATVVVDAPAVLDWFEAQLEAPGTRQHWTDAGRNIGLILGAAILADRLANLLLMPLRRRMRRRRATRWGLRLLLLALEITLDALPALAFAITAYAIIPFVQPRFATEAVVRELVSMVLVARVILVLARAVLLAPTQAAWAIMPLSEETANYLYIWVRRFVFWAVYGFGVIGASWWLGVPGSVFTTLQKAVALVIAVLAVVFVLQNRHAVALWLRPHPPRPVPPAGRGLRTAPRRSSRRRPTCRRAIRRSICCATGSPISGTCWRSSISSASTASMRSASRAVSASCSAGRCSPSR